ncbi:hypothetical protein ACFXPX_36730 [Kitasatospora sp. NPDC059146]|uniref:hypothetical protein n=1 Tax=unclassified Kitasatospora TaxID=2633591 RepID=UPI00367C2362
MLYQLLRTRPTGVTKSQKPFRTPYAAAMAASWVLTHKGVGYHDAMRLVTRMRRAGVGQAIRHAGTGYTFRIAIYNPPTDEGLA